MPTCTRLTVLFLRSRLVCRVFHRIRIRIWYVVTNYDLEHRNHLHDVHNLSLSGLFSWVPSPHPSDLLSVETSQGFKCHVPLSCSHVLSHHSSRVFLASCTRMHVTLVVFCSTGPFASHVMCIVWCLLKKTIMVFTGHNTTVELYTQFFVFDRFGHRNGPNPRHVNK